MNEREGIINLSDASEEYQEEFIKYFNAVESLFPQENFNQMKFKGDVLTNLLTYHIVDFCESQKDALDAIDIICDAIKRTIKNYEK